MNLKNVQFYFPTMQSAEKIVPVRTPPPETAPTNTSHLYFAALLSDGTRYQTPTSYPLCPVVQRRLAEAPILEM